LNNEASQQAGLLASGSSEGCLAFPFDAEQWLLEALVPGYSGGSATDLHRLPFSALLEQWSATFCDSKAQSRLKGISSQALTLNASTIIFKFYP